MRTKETILIGLMLVLLTACGGGGSDSVGGGEVVPPPTNPTNPEQGGGDTPYSAGPAMAFSAVFADREGEKAAGAPARQGVTRSGEAPQPGDGEFTNTDLQASGFGVYCWYTGDNTYIEGSDIRSLNPKPTILMLNQQVIYSGEQWTYSPTKYWPLQASHKLTFRAYAPYVSYQLQTNATTGLPMLPVVVAATDYHNGTQHDPLWGTAKHGGTDGDAGTTYGVLYDNYTYAMSGDKLTLDEDEHNGTINWYFHHGMSKLMFACSIIQDPGCSKVTIKSITIENLYTQGLLSLSSPTASESEKPIWDEKDGNMTVTLSEATPNTNPGDLAPAPGADEAHQYPYVITITNPSQPTGPFNLLGEGLGLLIIPRDFESEGLKVTVAYTIDTDETKLEAKATIKRNFKGNTSYTLNMKLTPSTKGLEITTVQSAFTPWIATVEGDHEVYNW